MRVDKAAWKRCVGGWIGIMEAIYVKVGWLVGWIMGNVRDTPGFTLIDVWIYRPVAFNKRQT